MKEKPTSERRRLDEFGKVVANASVRAYFHELLSILSNLHDGVSIHRSPVDIRAEYAGRTICRVVPYRELIHLHIGDAPVWEVRIREEAGYLDAVDRILDVFLAIAAADSRAHNTGRAPAAIHR